MTKLQTAWLVFYYFLFVRKREVIRQNLFVFFFNFLLILHYFGGLQHWSVIMQKNDDAYLLYFIKLTVSLLILSLKWHLQFHSFFLQFKAHHVTALMCTILCSHSL